MPWYCLGMNVRDDVRVTHRAVYPGVSFGDIRQRPMKQGVRQAMLHDGRMWPWQWLGRVNTDLLATDMFLPQPQVAKRMGSLAGSVLRRCAQVSLTQHNLVRTVKGSPVHACRMVARGWFRITAALRKQMLEHGVHNSPPLT